MGDIGGCFVGAVVGVGDSVVLQKFVGEGILMVVMGRVGEGEVEEEGNEGERGNGETSFEEEREEIGGLDDGGED